MRRTQDAADADGRDHLILSRMMADAERLCGTRRCIHAGQYRFLRGRVAALIEMTTPIERGRAQRMSSGLRAEWRW